MLGSQLGDLENMCLGIFAGLVDAEPESAERSLAFRFPKLVDDVSGVAGVVSGGFLVDMPEENT